MTDTYGAFISTWERSRGVLFVSALANVANQPALWLMTSGDRRRVLLSKASECDVAAQGSHADYVLLLGEMLCRVFAVNGRPSMSGATSSLRMPTGKAGSRPPRGSMEISASVERPKVRVCCREESPGRTAGAYCYRSTLPRHFDRDSTGQSQLRVDY